jgi:hypothetical protein
VGSSAIGRRLATIAALAIVAVASRAAAGEIGIARSPVVGGEPSLAADDDVLYLDASADGGPARCSAVLVAPDRALTARHCVSEVVPGLFRCDEHGELSLAFGDAGRFGGDRNPHEIAIYFGTTVPPAGSEPDARGRAIEHDRAKTVCDADLATLVLDRPVPRPPRAIARRRPEVGDLVRVIGWGRDAHGAAVDVRQTRAVRITRVGPVVGTATQSALGPHEIAAGEGACDGDSGGGVVDEDGALVAIVVRGTGAALQARGPNCFGAKAESIFRTVVASTAREVEIDAPSGCGVGAQGRSSPILVAVGLGFLAAVGRARSR